jgi:eukaryotic-like serine/threonine-protein kinase
MSLIGRSIGNYEIKAKIGEGGMGTVYVGEHPLIGKRVAIKVLLDELAAKPEVVTRFFHEAKAVNDIGHQNIVDIVDFGKTTGERGEELVYFVMEFLDGDSLQARIHGQPMPFVDTLHILSQCTSALAASHAKGIVHRDLKPDNIFLVSRGGDRSFAKLLDFGIAKLTGDGVSQSNKTRTGLVIGTPTYMSPEQCEGKGLIDHRSDVYSLGIVMYEMLTGVVPFPGEGFGEILVAHLMTQPAPPSSVNSGVTPELEAIVLHAIEKDRNRRFQDMGEFLAALSDPAAHARQWRGLPAHVAPTLQRTVAELRPQLGDGGRRGPTSGLASTAPTTLEGAAAEVAHAPSSRRTGRSSLWAGLAVGAVAVAGGIVGVSRLGAGAHDATPAVAPPAQVAPLPAAPAEVTITVASDPPGARVQRADRAEAEPQRTPISFKLHRGDPSFDVQLRLDGYAAQTRTITAESSTSMLIALAPSATVTPVAAKPEASAPPLPAHASAPHHSGSHSSSTKPKKAGGEKGAARPADDADMQIIEPHF